MTWEAGILPDFQPSLIVILADMSIYGITLLLQASLITDFGVDGFAAASNNIVKEESQVKTILDI